MIPTSRKAMPHVLPLHKWLVVACLLLMSPLVAMSTAVAASGDHRLQPDDLRYQGAFRLPDALNWGARGLSFYPDGNGGKGSLFVTGFQGLLDESGEACHEASSGCTARFAEIGIPEPATQSDWQKLPLARFIREPAVFDGGLVATVSKAYSMTAGIARIPRQGKQISDKLYGSLNAWYPEGEFGDASFPTVWFSELDGSNARGPFHVGPHDDPLFHGRKMGEFLFSVPAWYADRYLGGRLLVTGRTRGTPVGDGERTTAGGSQGPALFAFAPWQSETPSGDLDAIPLLYYRSAYPACAGPDIGVGGQPVECDYPGFSMCDSWNGADFVGDEKKNAIILAGHKGTTNCYYCDESGSDPECPRKPLANECRDWCGEGRGYHCGPYKRQLLFYDTAQLGESALGKVDPWSLLPYRIWEPELLFVKPENGNSCADLGGLAHDARGKRLFLVERGLGGYQGDNAAVMHVWTMP